MDRNLYVEALFADPVLATIVKVALDDGLIDRDVAELAWLAMAAGLVVPAMRSEANIRL